MVRCVQMLTRDLLLLIIKTKNLERWPSFLHWGRLHSAHHLCHFAGFVSTTANTNIYPIVHMLNV